MKIVIDIPEDVYAAACVEAKREVHPNQDYRWIRILRSICDGTPLPKGHGRLIDADAFIDGLRDSSKRQRYNECFIDELLTVDDVFQAVIESLENKGLAEGDAPTIIEADKEAANEID